MPILRAPVAETPSAARPGGVQKTSGAGVNRSPSVDVTIRVMTLTQFILAASDAKTDLPIPLLVLAGLGTVLLLTAGALAVRGRLRRDVLQSVGDLGKQEGESERNIEEVLAILGRADALIREMSDDIQKKAELARQLRVESESARRLLELNREQLQAVRESFGDEVGSRLRRTFRVERRTSVDRARPRRKAR